MQAHSKKKQQRKCGKNYSRVCMHSTDYVFEENYLKASALKLMMLVKYSFGILRYGFK